MHLTSLMAFQQDVHTINIYFIIFPHLQQIIDIASKAGTSATEDDTSPQAAGGSESTSVEPAAEKRQKAGTDR